MSHGYNPAGNSSGGQWQAGYQQQGQAAQPAQPQSYAGQPQQQFGGAQYAGPQSYAGQPQGNPQQYAGQQYPPPQASQQYGGAQYAQPQQYAAPQSASASGQGAGGYAQGGQQYAQSGQGGAPQVASQQYAGVQAAQPQQYAGVQAAQPQQYAAPQSVPASGQGAGGYAQGGQQYAQPQQFAGQVQGGGQQYAAPQSAPSQQVQASAQLAKDPRADDWIRLKGRANVAILNSALRFFGFPFLSLLIGIAKAHDVYDAAKQLGAPSDVLLRARIAMGTAALLIFVQLAILVVVVIGANM